MIILRTKLSEINQSAAVLFDLANIFMEGLTFQLYYSAGLNKTVPYLGITKFHHCCTKLETCVASFPNESGSKKSGVKIEVNFHTF